MSSEPGHPQARRVPAKFKDQTQLKQANPRSVQKVNKAIRESSLDLSESMVLVICDGAKGACWSVKILQTCGRFKFP